MTKYCKLANVRIITQFGGDLVKEMFSKMGTEKNFMNSDFQKAESSFRLGKEHLNMRQAKGTK